MIDGLNDKIQIFENQYFTVKYLKQVRRSIANTTKRRLKIGNILGLLLVLANIYL
jgi:hypothetical protein